MIILCRLPAYYINRGRFVRGKQAQAGHSSPCHGHKWDHAGKMILRMFRCGAIRSTSPRSDISPRLEKSAIPSGNINNLICGLRI